jgi:hypothetical protein
MYRLPAQASQLVLSEAVMPKLGQREKALRTDSRPLVTWPDVPARSADA